MKLHVQTFGSGPIPMLAFHGIGQDAGCFQAFGKSLGEQYTIFSFDLFFHGQSPALPVEVLEKSVWKTLIEAFLDEHQLTTFAVTGFSMGGKFALVTAELFPQRVCALWLLAPDGVTVSPWYRFATQFAITKAIFRYFMRHFGLFQRFAHVVKWTGLVSKSTIRFAESTLATPAQRAQVYQSWVGFSRMNPDWKRLIAQLDASQLPIKLFLGKYDALLPARYLLPLVEKVSNVELTILACGHHRLVEKAAAALYTTAAPSPPPPTD
jgi:pimeloyl-ACP methyl ester carboxylesterase